MPAKTNDQSPFGEGDLNQELIDQMLNGGDLGGTVQPEPWADDTLQAEIDAARSATGVGRLGRSRGSHRIRRTRRAGSASTGTRAAGATPATRTGAACRWTAGS